MPKRHLAEGETFRSVSHRRPKTELCFENEETVQAIILPVRQLQPYKQRKEFGLEVRFTEFGSL